MNTAPRRPGPANHTHRPFRTKPRPDRTTAPRRAKAGFATYYALGVRFAKYLEPHTTFEDIGAALGVTKQNAYTETVVALGKLVHRIKSLAADPQRPPTPPSP